MDIKVKIFLTQNMKALAINVRPTALKLYSVVIKVEIINDIIISHTAAKMIFQVFFHPHSF